MRQKRMRAPGHWSSAYYHCISRVVGREFLLGASEKDQFVKLMRKYEAFCLVRVVSYCVMDNHFHLLVEESQKPIEMSDSQLLAHLKATRSREEYTETQDKLSRWRAYADQSAADALVASYLQRIGNVSFFMKALKQEFTQWFNRTHKRTGTLWESRFKSVLINVVDADALSMMAAYIDLNPVRAGIVIDPREYKWSSIADACHGSDQASAGVQQVVNTIQAARNAKILDSHQSLEVYGRLLNEREQTSVSEPDHSADENSVLMDGNVSKVFRVRLRHFTDGGVIGTRQSVDEVFEHQRWRFGAKRKSGARKIKHIEIEGLCSLRDLKINI